MFHRRSNEKNQLRVSGSALPDRFGAEGDPAHRREFPRWQFHQVDVPLAMQSQGIAARVYRQGLLFDRLIAQVVVKDMSLGGAGLLVPSQYPLPKKLLLSIDDADKPLQCLIMHRYPVDAALHFVGVSWYRVKSEQVLRTVGNAVREFNLAAGP